VRNATKIDDEERGARPDRPDDAGQPAGDGVPVSLPLDDLPQRVLLLLLLLAREAELAVEQVDSPRSRALVRGGLTGGARVSLPCSPGRRGPSLGARPWMCQGRTVA
jgi:hypothetical protein